MNILNYFLAERWFSKGQKYFNLDDPKLAIDAYRKALSISPSHSGVHLHQAIALSRLGDYKSATIAVDKVAQNSYKTAVCSLRRHFS